MLAANDRQSLPLAFVSLPESSSHFAIKPDSTVGTVIRVKINTIESFLSGGLLFFFGFSQAAVLLAVPGHTWHMSSYSNASGVLRDANPCAPEMK